MTAPAVVDPSVTALLAAAVWDDGTARHVAPLVPDETVSGAALVVLTAVRALVDLGVPVEPSSVHCRIVDDRMAGWDDARRWLLDLIGAPTPVGTVGWHLDRLRQQAARDRLTALATTVAQVAQGSELHDAVHTIRERLDRVDLGASTAPPSLADLTDAALNRLESGDTTRTLSTGLADLDKLLGGGLRPGQLVVVGARPGVGKSCLLTDLARAATNRGARVLLHSLEMARDEVWARHASATCRVPLDRLMSAALNEDDWTRIGRSLASASDDRLHVDDRPGVTVSDIAATARTVGPDLLGIDYLQLVRVAKPSGSRQEDVAGLSRGLKLLARDLRCPVVVAAQLNRGQTNRADSTPRMSDLRESGAIEADADVVLLLDRDDDDDTHGTTGRLDVAKNRSGPRGVVELAFHGAFASFASLHKWEQA